MSERSIFTAAMELDAPQDRARYLAEACGADPAMRERIETLLRAHVADDRFLETPPFEQVTLDGFVRPLAEGPGSVIGPYKLLQKLGEGGMGVVYMAEAQQPPPGAASGGGGGGAARPKVALKIIKPGMDSDQVVVRFDAERQALSLMDHPNIAKVIDAGATATGRPFFVMELVHGTPITAYCDEHRLGLRPRLELFADVCRAVQHAHTKGVIHRDIKPSNVLVTTYDGRAVPKVIDFGVAKAIEQRLTERTLFTHYGALVGTLGYMAPEQAEMSALGVDTRSDVYSLGVLLYELLTGTTPLGQAKPREAAFLELLRQVRDAEPPTPSTRLSTAGGDALATIAASRGTDPQKLARLVRGELDWIVMKCLEKDRTRRYETADGLAQDVGRYLADEPVAAGPPGARYRLGKFARRNKGLLIAASAVAAALLLGTGLATYGLVKARRGYAEALDARAAEARGRQAAVAAMVLAERERALADASAAAAKQEAVKSAAVNRFLRDMLASGGPGGPGGPGGASGAGGAGAFNPTVRDALDRAVKELDDGKLAAHGDVEAAVRQTVGSAYVSLGQLAAAEVQLNAALALQKRLLDPAHPDVAATLHAVGGLHKARKWWGTAADHFREALAIRRRAFGEEHELVAFTLAELADSVTRDAVVRGVNLDEANALNERAAALVRKVSGARSARAADTLQSRAVVLGAKRDWPGAEALYREAQSIYREVFGDRHVQVAQTAHMLGVCRANQGDDAGAESLLRQAVNLYAESLGPEHPSLSGPLDNLGRVLDRRGDPGAAAAVAIQWLRVEVARLTGEMKALPDDPKLPGNRATMLSRLGRFTEATADWELAIRSNPDNLHARFCAAIGKLYEGDVGAYRSHARAMTERAPKSAENSAWEWTAKVCLLGPARDRAEAAAAMRFVDRDLATRDPKTSAAWMGWAELTKALAEYRTGDSGACLAWVGRYRVHAYQVNYGDRRYHEGFSLALAAMALHGLGEAGDARWCVDESARLMERCPEPGRADLGDGPENWQMWAILLREARALVARGPAARAAPRSTAGVTTGSPREVSPGERLAVRIQMEGLKVDVARLTAELKARPNDARRVHERAVANGRLGRFAESTADWETKTRLDPADWHAYFAAAVGRLHRGDVEAYRAHAREMTARFSKLGDWGSQERLAKTYALAPPPPDAGKDLAAAAMRMIDGVLATQQHHGPSQPWFQLTKAMVEYRAGNMAACLEWTIKTRANNPDVTFGDRRYPQGTALALAAMAHHGLGRPDEARQALAESDRLMAEAPRPGERDLGDGQENWQVWAVFLREARDLIAGGVSPAPTTPRTHGASDAVARAGDPDAAKVEALRMAMLAAEVSRLTAEVKATPNDPARHDERAIWLSHLGRFRESLADRERTVALDPDHCDARFSVAVARLYFGDVAGYRGQVREMLRRYAGRRDSGDKDRVAKTFLLHPPPGGSKADVAAAGRLADEALILPHGDDVTAFIEMTNALAEYRAGRFEACLGWLERSWSHPAVWGDRRNLDGTCLALAAMARHRLGRAEDAARTLEASERLLAQCPQPGKADLGIGPNNRLIWEIVLREARGVVGRSAAAAGGR